jgi:hypothetical protein
MKSLNYDFNGWTTFKYIAFCGGKEMPNSIPMEGNINNVMYHMRIKISHQVGSKYLYEIIL